MASDVNDAHDDPRVAVLLADSLAAHRRAGELRKQGNQRGSRDALMTALRLREEAHALDPVHEAPAWTLEQDQSPRGKDTHAEMMAFYRQQLGAAV